jgi:hypothetical protein
MLKWDVPSSLYENSHLNDKYGIGKTAFLCYAGFSWLLASCVLDAKTCKVKSLPKESDKAKIILLSFFHLVRDLILLRTPGKERVCRKQKRCDRWPVGRAISRLLSRAEVAQW